MGEHRLAVDRRSLPETEKWFNIRAVTQDSPLDRPTPHAGRARYAKSRDTRARILAAALEEASDSGFHGAAVARIAARAGVAVGTLDYHFGSRRELLSLVSDLLTRLHALDADDSADFFERQRAGLLAYLDHLRANPAYLRLADEIKLLEPDLYQHAVGGWVERMAAWIRLGIEQGTLRPMDDAEIAAQAHFLLGARHFLEQMIETEGSPPDDSVVDAYLALVRDGLGR
jgi:AcrR family transcriptional regulator